MLFKKKQKILSYPCHYYIQNNINNSYKKISFLLTILFFVLILFFLINYYINYNNNYNYIIKNNIITEDKKNDYPLFSLAWQEVQRHFIYINKINKEEIDLAITKKMIEKLNCPNTRLSIAHYPQAFIREIGIGIEKRKEYVKIISVEKKGPADGKVIIGDKLKYINNKNIKDLSIQKIAKKLKGKIKIEIKITILRNEILKEINIIKREIIDLPPLPANDIPPPPTVKWKLKEGNIAYIQIFRFGGSLYFDFKQVVNEILNSPTQKIILDLRNNPGGELGIVKRISEHFLRQGDIILIEKKIDKKIEHISKKTGQLVDFEIIVLINNNSISGAEIMTATLRDNKNSILIGEKSFGKASIQRVFHLKERYSIILTTNTWLTPAGEFINQKGIVPDYKIIDPAAQLNKAFELLRKK